MLTISREQYHRRNLDDYGDSLDRITGFSRFTCRPVHPENLAILSKRDRITVDRITGFSRFTCHPV